MKRLMLLLFQISAISTEFGLLMLYNDYPHEQQSYMFIYIGLLVAFPSGVYSYRKSEFLKRFRSL